MADKGKRERGDSTMDVLPHEVVDSPRDDASLDRLLGELEDEVERSRPVSSMPPPLPRARASSKGAKPRGSSRAAPRAPEPSARTQPPSVRAPRAGASDRASHRPTEPPRSAPPPPRSPPRDLSSRTGAYALGPRPSSVPPPIPSTRPPSRTSAPPPPPRSRVSGLGRPGSIPPPRMGHPTVPGIPVPDELDSEEQTLVAVHDTGGAATREWARELATRWEAELAETRDRARKGRLGYELGRLYEGPLRDLAKASGYYQAALASTPDHLPTLRGARRVAIAQRDHRAALPLFDAEARVTADSRRKAALLYTKARLLEDALGERDQARAIYAIAAELDRKDASILKALEQRDADAPERLERTYEREANAVASDARHRAALIVERARVLEHHHERVDAALELYETALKLDPHARAALDAIDRLAWTHGRWRELIRALSLEAEQSSDPAARALAHYRIGRVHAERLGNREEALAALERAREARPDDPLVLEELAALYERSARFDALVSVLARLAEITSDASEQLAAWHRIGQLHDERLASPADARAAYERAIALDPTHVPTLQALGRIYEAAGEWDALAAMHLAEAEEVSDAKRAAAAHARVAGVLEQHGGRVEEAMAHHARALSLSPGYAPSFKALARLYADAGKHRELIELYERAVEQADEPEPAITHLFKIGAIYEDALGEHAQAAHTYRRILERDAKNLGALHALQRATERAGRHAELVDALEREAALRGDDARSVELLARAAEILDEHLGDRDGAIARYRRVLAIDPRHTPSIGGLGRIYHRAGRWEDLLELYRRELELEETKRGAAALLHKMGLLCEERIGDEAQALECHRRAIEIDPTHRPSLDALARRLAARGEHAELVRVLERMLEGLTDPAAHARAAFRLGEVHERLRQPDRAATAYESALASVSGYAPAEAALARLRAAQGAWRRLVDQLEEEAARASSPAVAVARLTRAGELWARALGDPRRAAGCYERALELSPRHLESLLALERLYRALSRHDALARVYGTLARVLSDPGARVAALRELARLQARGERDPDELRQIHEAILGLAPDDPSALEALEALALERGDRALLARVDRRLVMTAGDAKVAAAYQTRLAESLEAAGDTAALDAFRAALESDPENIAAARGLARVAARQNVPEAIVEAARREAAAAPEPRIAARHLVEAAKVAEAKLGDARAAAKDFERALELWPDDADAAAGLTALLVTGDQAARAADRLARAAASAKSAERIAALWMEVARLQADLLDNVPGALTSLGRVLKSSPQHVPTLRRLAELHARQGRWHDAASLLAQVVSLAPDREVLKAAHLELARIWAERSNDLSRALVSLQAVLALEENHPEALARMADVAARSGDLDKAALMLRRLVDRATSPADRAIALLRAADVHHERGDDDAAKRAIREALSIQGPSGAAYERHRQLATERADWKAHADALKAWLASGAHDDEGVRIASLEIARVHREVLEQPAGAIEVLEEAVRAHPDLELRRALSQALRHAGRYEQSIAELRSLIGESVVRAELWRELSHTLRAAGDEEGARRALVPLVLLGSAHGEELREVTSRTIRAARARPGSLDASLLEALYPLRRAGALIQLWRHLMQGLGKLYPPDFDAFGVSSRDRMSTRSPEPLRKIADRVSAIFGTGEVHLYRHRTRARGIAVELTTPPSILLPAAAVELGEAHQAFTLARASANIALGLHAVDKLTPRELEIVLAAAARHVAPGFGAGLTSEDVLEDIKKRLGKALSRRARKELDELAREYVAGGEHDFAIVTEAIVASACRVALLVADDLLAAIEVLKRTERDLAELSGPRLLAHPTVTRLARFWISPEADALRQRMGQAEPTLAQKTTP